MRVLSTEKWPYSPLKALVCKMLGHDYMAYDFGTDMCLRCNKKLYNESTDLTKRLHCHTCWEIENQCTCDATEG